MSDIIIDSSRHDNDGHWISGSEKEYGHIIVLHALAFITDTEFVQRNKDSEIVLFNVIDRKWKVLLDKWSLVRINSRLILF